MTTPEIILIIIVLVLFIQNIILNIRQEKLIKKYEYKNLLLSVINDRYKELKSKHPEDNNNAENK